MQAVALFGWIVVVLILVRIGWSDLNTRKIFNRDVAVLAVAGVFARAIDAYAAGAWYEFGIGVGTGAIFFVLLFPLWLFGKIGAGDVKLFSVVVMICSPQGILHFNIILLALLLILLVLSRSALIEYLSTRLQHPLIDQNRSIPFGVPISLAAIVTVLINIV